MVGLKSGEFFRRLLDNEDIYLYCTEITKKLLLADGCECIEKSIKILPFVGSSIIKIPSPNGAEWEEIAVTAIPAGHCPGSAMFFIESKSCNILFTGDFRIVEGDISKFLQLHDSKNSVKKIDSLYLDTTFADPSYSFFPKREESVIAICELIKEWISLSRNHHVMIDTPAQYGSEYIFTEIHKILKQQIHVPDKKYRKYKGVAEMEMSVTANPSTTQIHSCKFGKFQCLNKNLRLKFRIIKPAAWWFKGKLPKHIVEKFDAEFYKVAYSSHSSYKEIVHIVNYLKPKKIYPIGVSSDKTINQVRQLLAFPDYDKEVMEINTFSNSVVKCAAWKKVADRK